MPGQGDSPHADAHSHRDFFTHGYAAGIHHAAGEQPDGYANGHTNAGSLARIYAALANGGALDGVRLLSPEAIERARQLRFVEQRPALFP